MNVNDIKESLNHFYDTNIFRIAFLSDSIWSPIGDVIETDGSHPPRLKKNTFIRQLYDYLNYNKPVFRSIEHSDWSHTGGELVNSEYPDNTDVDKIRLLSDNADNSIIQISGYSTVVFWFECGILGETIDTGTVKIEVSSDGINYDTPSNLEIIGKRNTVRVGDEVTYEDVIDEISTNRVIPAPFTTPTEAYVSFLPIQYNLPDTNLRYFRISQKTDETKPIRLGGCYYFTGKTCMIYNISIPGAGWPILKSVVYANINLMEMNMVFLQAPLYHDFYATSTITQYAKDIISLIKTYTNRIILCACTPGGVVVKDSSTVLGDEEPSYIKGQNFVKEFNHRYGWNITKPTYADYPTRGSVYSITIGETVYNLTCVLPKCSEVNFDTWAYNSKVGLCNYDTFPIDSITYPATLTKVSGTGADSIILNSRYYFPPAMNTHRDLMKAVAQDMGLQFIDFYKLFADLAIANGETIETDAYEITEESPLYEDYPDGMENFLSRYFNPNHWRESTNSIVYNEIKKLFIGFNFK